MHHLMWINLASARKYATAGAQKKPGATSRYIWRHPGPSPAYSVQYPDKSGDGPGAVQSEENAIQSTFGESAGHIVSNNGTFLLIQVMGDIYRRGLWEQFAFFGDFQFPNRRSPRLRTTFPRKVALGCDFCPTRSFNRLDIDMDSNDGSRPQLNHSFSSRPARLRGSCNKHIIY